MGSTPSSGTNVLATIWNSYREYQVAEFCPQFSYSKIPESAIVQRREKKLIVKVSGRMGKAPKTVRLTNTLYEGFSGMAEDTVYQRDTSAISEEFAESDAETLRIADERETET